MKPFTLLFIFFVYLVPYAQENNFVQNWHPKGNYDQIIKHQFYKLAYSEDHEQAEWVLYLLSPNNFLDSIKRSNNFREDPQVLTGSSQLKDYKKSGYDRGHLAPAADMKYSNLGMKESFYMSNMSPQQPKFNRGIWKKIELQFRKWAATYQELIVITGGVLNRAIIDTIGINNVAVPGYYYKVAIDPSNYNRNIAFLIKNCSSKAPLISHVVSIDSLEKFSEINFFHHLEDEIEQEIESQINYNLWKWSE